MKKIRIGALIIALAVPLAVGGVSALLTMNSMEIYGTTLVKPPLSPPAWLFPVAWTILYIMMGLASYLIYTAETDANDRTVALAEYAIQLTMNFFWSIIFFNMEAYFIAFVWLIVMWSVVIICTVRFYRIRKLAGIMLIPYILWLTFAAYLNMGVYVLSF